MSVRWPGLPGRRIDQRRQLATAATAPGSSSTIRARIIIVSGPGDGVFVYSGTPALGNLPIAWISSGLTDPYGNTLPAEGIVSYQAPAYAQLFGGQVVIVNTAAGAQANVFINDSGVLEIAGSQVATLLGPRLLLPAQSAAPAGTATFGTFYANANGTPAGVSAGGLAGTLPLSQVDISNHNVGNTGTAGDITKAWPIPAGDGAAGTTYTIKARASFTTGQTTVETLTLGVDVSGTLTPLATLGAAFNGSGLNISYDIPIELALIVDAAGVANTPEIYISGALGEISANRLATNSVSMAGHTTAATFNKANANTLAVYAQWGGAGGSDQNILTVASRFYREGP